MDREEIIQKISSIYNEEGIELIYPPYRDYVVARNKESGADLNTGGGDTPYRC